MKIDLLVGAGVEQVLTRTLSGSNTHTLSRSVTHSLTHTLTHTLALSHKLSQQTSSLERALGWFWSASSQRSHDRDFASTEREVDIMGLSRAVGSGMMNCENGVA